ncbi:Carbonic anhydrase [uncultured archaeon]|nr:Carbonic anhydrase [uncultured archaeon]
MASGADVLADLLKGCEKFRACEPPLERARHAKGQSPKAAVLYCSDSREVAEKLFSCEKRGEIFGIRLAGNVASEEAIQSAVYAVEHLHVPLLLVLGHSGCGAVGAKKKGGDKKLEKLLSLVEPDEKLNVREQVKRLIANEVIAGHIEAGKLLVAGAIHDLETGSITELVRVSSDSIELRH